MEVERPGVEAEKRGGGEGSTGKTHCSFSWHQVKRVQDQEALVAHWLCCHGPQTTEIPLPPEMAAAGYTKDQTAAYLSLSANRPALKETDV